MAKRTVVVMPGDGIGNVVLPEALRVLEAAGFEAIEAKPMTFGIVALHSARKPASA